MTFAGIATSALYAVTLALDPVILLLALRTVGVRFYRSRYDAGRALDACSTRLRDEVDLDAVRSGLIDAVHDTVQPVHASVWLRITGR
jgi:hypothetical protein